MFANTLIILFILAMTCWWGPSQGVFSAFLQLMVTILSAALAIALWEPTVLVFLIRHIPKYAWGAGLLGPFILWLIVLRVAANRLISSSIELGSLVNIIGGSACGLLSGVLASGMTVLGVGFLPLPPDAGGYRPMVIQEKWTVTENPDGQLWFPVDRYALSILNMLSAGVFSSGYPLATYQPNPVMQAALFRMRFNPDSSIVAMPHSIRVTHAYGWPLPIEGLDPVIKSYLAKQRHTPVVGRQLIVVDTMWQIYGPAIDADGMLRVPPTQIRLVTHGENSNTRNIKLHAPVGWIQTHEKSGQRVFTALDSSAKPVLVHRPQEERHLGWVFVIPVEEQTQFILTRRLRHILPKLDSDPLASSTMVGQPQRTNVNRDPTIAP